MVDRLHVVKELPPLTPEQRKKLLTDILPPGHKLTEENIQEVMERVQGGSIRLLQGMGGMITNCARVGGKMVPPTREHVLEALAVMQETEREKEGATARSGLAAPATTAATALVASPNPATANASEARDDPATWASGGSRGGGGSDEEARHLEYEVVSPIARAHACQPSVLLHPM